MKPLWLPLALIVAVSALLLAMDEGTSRHGTLRLPKIALVQFAPQAALDEGMAGVQAGLSERGFRDGDNVQFEQFNAQGDLATANDIARRVTDGSWDLVVTISTASLQTVANANKDGRVRHIFGVVTDPSILGIGFSATDPLDHPPHMAGYSSFAPVGEVLAFAREMNPSLKRLGLVWHTSEANSEAYTKKARALCAALGIELLEANAETVTNVAEAAASLTARGVDALLLTGDVLVLTAVDPLVAVAKRARIPVISMIPPNVEKGVLFDLGADYRAIGREIGHLAADVLGGRDTAAVPLENRVPRQLLLNLDTLAGLDGAWRLPPDRVAQASIVIEAGAERRQPEAQYR